MELIFVATGQSSVQEIIQQKRKKLWEWRWCHPLVVVPLRNGTFNRIQTCLLKTVNTNFKHNINALVNYLN